MTLTPESQALLAVLAPGGWTNSGDNMTADTLAGGLAAIEAAATAERERCLEALPSLPQRLAAIEAAAVTAERERISVARFVATHWRDAVMANDSLRATGMSHPLAMVLAALDGERDPAQLGISEDAHSALRAIFQPDDE